MNHYPVYFLRRNFEDAFNYFKIPAWNYLVLIN